MEMLKPVSSSGKQTGLTRSPEGGLPYNISPRRALFDADREFRKTPSTRYVKMSYVITVGQKRFLVGRGGSGAFKHFALVLPDGSRVAPAAIGCIGTTWTAPYGYGSLICVRKETEFDWEVELTFLIPNEVRSATFRYRSFSPVRIDIPPRSAEERSAVPFPKPPVGNVTPKLAAQAEQEYQSAMKVLRTGPDARKKAIGLFQDIVRKYPGTRAAKSAAETVRKLQ